MALKFKNNATGRVVDMPEPHEVIAAAEAEAEVRARVGSKRAKREAEAIADRGVKLAGQAERTIKAMSGDCRRWSRYVEDVPVLAVPVVTELAGHGADQDQADGDHAPAVTDPPKDGGDGDQAPVKKASGGRGRKAGS